MTTDSKNPEALIVIGGWPLNRAQSMAVRIALADYMRCAAEVRENEVTARIVSRTDEVATLIAASIGRNDEATERKTYVDTIISLFDEARTALEQIVHTCEAPSFSAKCSAEECGREAVSIAKAALVKLGGGT